MTTSFQKYPQSAIVNYIENICVLCTKSVLAILLNSDVPLLLCQKTYTSTRTECDNTNVCLRRVSCY